MPEAEDDCLEVVRKWLFEDAYGFHIPATEWGQDLYASLQHVYAMAKGADHA